MNIMIRKLALGVCAVSLLLAIQPWSMAQSTTATLSGVITDASGGVLPGAQVAVTNTATGVRRSVTADAVGRFVAPQLPPGPYEVTATMSGFETLERRGITLAIGQEANLNLAMTVGAVTQQVVVTGEAPLVDTSNSAVSGVVDQQRIEALPLNGRDFSQLALVQPGTLAIRNGDQVTSKGYGTRVSMGGSRADQTAWLLDGTDIRSTGNFGTPGSAAGLMLGVEAVREFQVLTSNYSAELGGTSGGVINMVTKSGTNQLHGSAYEFLRNSDLDARNFFDIPSKPAFKRNQFGGSLGGRIKKDKTFFFGNYEGVIQRLGLTRVAIVPDANARQGLIPAAGGGLQQIQVAPEIRPYLDLYPQPNGPEVGGGLATVYAPGNNPVDEKYFVGRVDHHINDKQSLFARLTFDQGSNAAPEPVPIINAQIGAHSRYTTVQHDYVVSPLFLMTTRIAYNRTNIFSDEVPLISYPKSLEIFLGGYLPTFNFAGSTQFGPEAHNAARRVENLYQFGENLQYIHGSHSLKFGGSIDQSGYTTNGQTAGFNGSYTWSNLQAFLLDSRLLAFNAQVPGSGSYRTYRQYFYGAYIQDDWKMRSNFTWNLGLRYEPFSSPHERQGRESTLKDWATETSVDVKVGLFENPSRKNFSPRVGFAWDPRGDGKTAVRAGFGMFFMNIVGPYFEGSNKKSPPFFIATQAVLGNLASSVADMAQVAPSLLTTRLTSISQYEVLQWKLNPSYEVKFNFAVERQLPGNLSVSAGYMGDRGVHLWGRADANAAPPILVNGRPFVVAGTPRLNPSIAAGSTNYSDVQSFYNALQIEVKKRFSRGFQFQGSYTWSKNIDDSTTVQGTDYLEGALSQPYNPKADRGLSPLNLSHTLVINGIYDLPSPAHSGLPSALFGGWGISSVFSANSGTPFSATLSGRNAPDLGSGAGAQRPDLVAGRSSSSLVTGNPNGYIDRTAFVLPLPGFYGNAGRNILIGPGLINLDFTATKKTRLPIWEGSRLEFQAGFFNVMNRANFANSRSLAILNPSNKQYIAGAGALTLTTTPSRQLQFGLKLVF